MTTPSLPRLRRIAELTETTVSDLVRAPDAATAHAAELAALREELAETRELVDRVARALEQSSAASIRSRLCVKRRKTRDVELGQVLDVDGEAVGPWDRRQALHPSRIEDDVNSTGCPDARASSKLGP